MIAPIASYVATYAVLHMSVTVTSNSVMLTTVTYENWKFDYEIKFDAGGTFEVNKTENTKLFAVTTYVATRP